MSSIVPFGEKTVAVIERFAAAAENLETEVLACEDPVEAFELVDSGLTNGVTFTKGSLLYTVYCVALAKQAWQELDVSQQEPFGPNFYVYVGRRFGTSQSPSTVDNYVNVGKTWLLRSTQINIPSSVQLYILDEELYALPLVEDENPFLAPGDPWAVNYAKLLVARSRAEKEAMTEEDWGLLFNPAVSQGRLLSYWRGPEQERNVSRLVFTLMAGLLCVSDGVDSVPFAQLDSEAIESNPLAKQGWFRIQAVLDIGREDDF